MSLALVHSRAKSGAQAPAVRVEVYLAAGLPVLNMVGLPEAAVRESRDRVRAAIFCAQLEFPNRRITVNLAPADLPKDGGRFDLPLALDILAANGAIDPQALNEYEFIGELALTGELRAIDGVLPAALAAKQAGRRMIVPLGIAAEAGLARAKHLYTARTLMEVVHHLRGERRLPKAAGVFDFIGAPMPDMADVRGQHSARRAMEIAAAGGHHMLLIGSPGCGRSAAHTTHRVRWRWPAAAPNPSPVKSRSLIKACYSSMSTKSGTAKAWSIAATLGIRRGQHLAGRHQRRLSGTLPAGRGHESLSLRLVRRQLGPLPL
jgi:magnesium chelatase family protein